MMSDAVELERALRQLGEARARYAELELRLVEAEAVIEQLRGEANAIVDTTRVNGTDFERGQENVAERVFDVLSVHPSVVLADHDKAVRQVALREAAEAVRNNAGTEDENGICEGVSNWPDASARTYSFAAHEAIEAIRALRVADQNGEHA